MNATTFFLVRHGTNDFVDHRIAGRQSGVHLNDLGRQQALGTAGLLGERGIQKIISSPLERARETAAPLAKTLHLEISIAEEITEIGFGDWTNQTMAELQNQENWRCWNLFRSGSQAPRGELMIQAQTRAIAFLHQLRITDAAQKIALFTHADIIRAVTAYYLGMPLDLFLRITIDPGSITVIQVEDYGPKILAVNQIPDAEFRCNIDAFPQGNQFTG
jgi:broad specificity phosphatase PhoE